MQSKCQSKFAVIGFNHFFMTLTLTTAMVIPAFLFSTGDILPASGLSASNTSIIVDKQPAHALKGSLTSCIEDTDVANGIEITGSAMKKAVQRVSGWMPKMLADEDASDTDNYCALSLV